MPRVLLVGNEIQTHPGTYASTGGSRGQYFVNTAFEVTPNAVKGDAKVFVRPREGFLTNAVAGLGTPSACAIWTGSADEVVIGSTVSGNPTLFTGGTSRGTMTGTVKFFEEGLISGVANLLIVTSNRMYYYGPVSLTEITDVDFPPKQTPALTITGRPVIKDGFIFIATTNGQIWNSDLNSVTSWTANSFISVDRKADSLRGVALYKDTIAAFGSASVEFFRNAGNPVGSPLSRIENGVIQVGCLNEKSYISIADTVAWIGGVGSCGVYVLDGMSAQKISIPAVEAEISNMSSARVSRAGSWGDEYLLVYEAAGSTRQWAYSFSARMWSLWETADSMTDSACFQPSTIGSQYSMIYVGTGANYYISDKDSHDAGAIQFGPIDFDTGYKKTCWRAQLIGTYRYNPSGSKNFSLTWSNNNGRTFSSAKTLTLGDDTDDGSAPRCHRLGSPFRARTWRLSWEAETNTYTFGWSLSAMDFEIEAHST